MAKALRVRMLTASTTVSVAQRVAPFAEKHKMTVAMHSNPIAANPNQFAGPESFQKAIGTSKYFAVNLDIAHFMAAGYDPVEYIRSHHDHIVLLHVKDRKKATGVNCPWGEREVRTDQGGSFASEREEVSSSGVHRIRVPWRRKPCGRIEEVFPVLY